MRATMDSNKYINKHIHLGATRMRARAGGVVH